MDEMNIRSSFLQDAVANMIEKLISKKIGYRPEIQFNDPIKMNDDGDKATVHLNMDVELKKEDLEGLINKLVLSPDK